MKASQLIKVNARYTRSINLERDHASKSDSDHDYVITARAADTLSRIFNALKTEGSPNSWALIGPYGAGKSAFGLFLADLFGNHKETQTKSSRRKLKETHSAEYESLSSLLGKSDGFFPILISGNPESLSDRLLLSLRDAATHLRTGKRGKEPVFAKNIREAVENKKSPSISQLMEWLAEIQTYAEKQGHSGILIVIDELGKFLEYEARHRSSRDIFLLQALAERTASISSSKFVLVTLLHQAFEQYVASFGKQLRDEWKKVQGRFETIPFVENSEQVITLLGKTLESTASEKLISLIREAIASNGASLRNFLGYSPSADDDYLATLLTNCYPLHPVSSSILPQLCQRVAQNERTLFTYLSSNEPNGFQDSLDKLEISEETLNWIYPHDIYEYFIQNHPGLISDQLTQRRWAEVTTAVERLGDAPEAAVNILKTIGLLNLVGAQSSIRASKQILQFTFPGTNAEFSKSIKILEERSVITFRKFSNEYRVWQGSDIDLDAVVSEERQQLSGLNLADLLNSREAISPIVARKHVINSGTLRYFRVRFAETPSELNYENESEHFINFCIPTTQEEIQSFNDHITLKPLPQSQLVGIVTESHHLRDAVIETVAYSRVRARYPDISADPIASRELKERFDAAISHERNLVSFLINSPEMTRWYWGQSNIAIDSKRQLQEKLSDILDRIYNRSPRINNEIINRNKLSGSGTSARRKLLLAMIENSHLENLGIEKSPPEKSIYLSMFASTGIHTSENQKDWKFSPPKEESNRYHEVWKEIDFLLSNNNETISIDFLQDRLMRAPFGITAGAMPLITLSYLLSRQNEIAVSEEGHFCPFLTFETVERILKKPQDFSIQRFGQVDEHQQILTVYQDIFDLSVAENTTPKDENNLVGSAKQFARFMMNLNDYTKSTKSLSKQAAEVRESFFSAKSPFQLMCIDIPKILGCPNLIEAKSARKNLEDFRNKLQGCISEIRSAHHQLINSEIRTELCRIFGEPKNLGLEELKSRLNSSRYKDLQSFTIDTQGLKAFIGRLTDSHGDGRYWIENVASFLARKPSEKWLDEDWESAKFRLLEYAAKIRDLEKLRALRPHSVDGTSDDTQIVLIRTLSENKEPTDKVAIINQSRVELVKSTVDAINQKLKELGDSELENAAMALLLRGDEYQKATGAKETVNTPTNKKRRTKISK